MISRSLRLEADAATSAPVADLVADLAGRAGLTRRQAYWLRLAADEVTTNAALHGYRGGRGMIDLAGGIAADRVWVRVEDDAPAFDPTRHDPAPRHRRRGGFGLRLALGSVDEFRYERTAGRNRSLLVIRRTAGPVRRRGNRRRQCWPLS